MAKNLVIVESPAKAKTLGKYLGDGFEVRASMGHVIDLPEKELGVDVDHGFRPSYEVIRGKQKVISELKRAAKGADQVFLAPDPDREGEAIAWHLAGILGKEDGHIHRVRFNEITKHAVLEAMQHPTAVNRSLFEAQQARRILDRLVGYQISPLLWKMVKRGLSAGRVQSVAVRMVCEREREIQQYQQKEYWSVLAAFLTGKRESLESKLWEVGRLRLVTRPDTEADRKDRFWIRDEQTAGRIAGELRGTDGYRVLAVERKEKKRNPPPPYITSTLQREAALSFGWPAKKTMQVAQTLYEGIDLGSEGAVGLITYMRTDSTRLADSAVAEVRQLIAREFGEKYLPKHPNSYVSRKGKVQDAHEAIRATSAFRLPDHVRRFLSPDQFKLYSLVWSRFVACQMNPAVYDQTTVDIAADPEQYLLRASGSVMRFAGFTKVYIEHLELDLPAAGAGEEDEGLLPALQEGDRLDLERVTPRQHFTQPPPRYTESSLIRELEANGIGRPSTYATIMSTIMDKEYVQRIKGALRPTDLGFTVNDLLVEKFPEILNVKFTAQMEGSLDEVEEGRRDWIELLGGFYGSFKPTLDKVKTEKKRVTIQTGIDCNLCGAPMVIRWSRMGEFLGCSKFPDCKNIKPFERDEEGGIRVVEEELTETRCEKCGARMLKKHGRYGPFLACSRYPDCSFIKPLSTGVGCPREGCSGELVQKKTRRGKVFYGCTGYPDCDFASWDRPLDRPCPSCGARPLFEKTTRGGKFMHLHCPACKAKLGKEEGEPDQAAPAPDQAAPAPGERKARPRVARNRPEAAALFSCLTELAVSE